MTSANGLVCFTNCLLPLEDGSLVEKDLWIDERRGVILDAQVRSLRHRSLHNMFKCLFEENILLASRAASPHCRYWRQYPQASQSQLLGRSQMTLALIPKPALLSTQHVEAELTPFHSALDFWTSRSMAVTGLTSRCMKGVMKSTGTA